MTHVEILIAMFVAARNPTHKNCAGARDALISQTGKDIVNVNEKNIHVDEDLIAVKSFVTSLCKDGVKKQK